MTLPDSPWTYENGSLNPDLEPSNARIRTASRRRKNAPDASSVPPWHPEYQETRSDHDSLASSDGEAEYSFEGRLGGMVRRGSEGYEVLPVDREEILRRYIESRGEEDGRYRRYVPEPPSESESEDELLSERVEKWKAKI